MLVASAGVAATSTFAWYSMGNAAVNAGTRTAGSIASASTTAGVGSFTVNITVANVDSVCLTADDGKTYVTDGTNNIEGTSAATKIAAPNITLAVSYSTTAGDGPESLTAGAVLGLWQAACDGKTIELTFSSNKPTAQESFDGDGSNKAFQLTDTELDGDTGVTVKVGGVAAEIASVADGLVTLSSAPAAGTGNVIIDYTDSRATTANGVKFTSGTSDYQQNGTDNVVQIAESEFADFEVASFSTPTGSKALGWTSTATMSDGVISSKVFMGLVGVNNVFQDHWKYSYSFTATIS